jgi:pimeloyl-ACP methyl ester carboxylesterase
MKAVFLAATALILGSTMTAHAEDTSGYAPINGLEMYYEVHGEGDPLVLLHGAYMSIPSNWDGLMPTLAQDHKVIAVELQNHGRTSDRDTPITYEGMADDVAALLDHLKIEKAALFGYSMGAAVAIRVAMQHPDKVTRIVAASGSISYDALPEGFADMVRTITPELFENTPFAAEYKRLSKTPENFPALVEKLKQLDLTPFSWSEAEFAKIDVPSLLIFGDADVIKVDHIAKMHKLLGGLTDGDTNGLPKTQLLVLPGTSHINVFFNPANVEIMKAVVPTFLKQDLPAKPSFSF